MEEILKKYVNSQIISKYRNDFPNLKFELRGFDNTTYRIYFTIKHSKFFHLNIENLINDTMRLIRALGFYNIEYHYYSGAGKIEFSASYS
jgi:hypothetical protein